MRFSKFSGRPDRILPSVVAVVVVIVFLVRVSFAADRALLLAVELNGRILDVLVETEERDGGLEVAVTDLPALGLRTAASGNTAGRVRLRDLPGLRSRVDEKRQVLVLDADNRALAAQQLRPDAPETTERPPVTPSGYGAVLNYDFLGSGGGTGPGVNGLLDLRASSPYASLSSGVLARQNWGTAVLPGRSVVRLDTVFATTEADSMRRWRVGDVITGGLAWTRPIRLGGVQVASDFSIRPDLVTFPLPELSGRAGVPSTVDVLVNGLRQLTQPVQPGPFELRQLPIVTGAGDVAVVVRDATGRESVRNLSFYASPVLLRPGLWSYDAEAGLVRTGYGVISDGYTKPAALGTVRRGVFDWLTLEAHGEGTGAVQMAGAGAAVSTMGQALLSASAAVSHNAKRTGNQLSVGFERAGPVLSVSASLSRASPGFRDVPSLNGTPVPRRTVRAGVGLSLGRWGGFNAAFIAADGGLLTAPLTASVLSGTRTRLVSATYTRPVAETVSFYATGYRDLARGGSGGISAGFSVALGPRRAANLAGGLGDGRPGGSLDVTQAAVEPGDYGWRTSATAGRVQQQQAELGTILPWGTANLGGEHVGRAYNGRAGLTGALVLAGDDLFAAQRVEDSFAVVDTDGLPGVQVLRENRLVGKTNGNGRLLVPDLRGWDTNRIAIDPSTMPGDVELGVLQQVVRPQDRAAVSVRFSARHGASALLRLVDAGGQAIPAGSTATLVRTGRTVPVGHDGEIFLTGLQGEETVEVSMARGHCRAQFRFVPRPGDIPEIGPVPCERTKE